MPTYNTSGFGPTPKLLLPGEPAYLFGSKTYNQADCKFNVTNVALTSNVATVTILITAGNIPAIGDLVSIKGSTSTSGLFNVTAVALTGVTIVAATGAGTITFALTHADVGSAADTGYGVIPVSELSETLANGASAPVCVDALPINSAVGRTLQAVCTFPTVPTTAKVTIQGALHDIDSEYQDIATVGLVAGSAVTQTAAGIPLQNWVFVRANVSTLAGSGKLICKLL